MRTLPFALILMLGASAAPALASGAEPNDASLGKKPPEGAIVLFNGANLDGWVKTDGKSPAAWPVADGIMTVGEGSRGGSIRTQPTFGDFQLHLEFNVPYMPGARGQA